MSLQRTGAPSSRVTKRVSKKSLSHSASSPFSSNTRRKPGLAQRQTPQKSAADENDGADEQPLEDVGLVTNISNISFDHVLSAVTHIREIMFEEVPERAGMNSVRIAEVLNYRKVLPPIVSVQHLHAIVDNPTATEREAADLIEKGILRRLIVPGRGNGRAGLGDGLVKVDEWERKIREASGLDDALKDKFIQFLRQHPKAISLPSNLFTSEEASKFLKSSLLVSSSPTRGTLNLSSTQTWNSDQDTPRFQQPDYLLTLPNTGPYLRLLESCRTHLIHLLTRSHSNEAPLYLLRDRWNGSVDPSNSAFKSKRFRGEFGGVLPGKTKKWKDLYGIRFEWALGECLGAGLVEVFETGSVGRGVRAI